MDHETKAFLEQFAAKFDGSLKGAVTELRTEMKVAIGELRTEMHSEIGGLRTEMRSQTGELRTEMRSQIGELRTEMGSQTGELRTEMGSQTGELRTEIGELRLSVKEQIEASETRIITAFWNWSRPMEARMRRLDTSDAVTAERLVGLEERMGALERRIGFKHNGPAH